MDSEQLNSIVNPIIYNIDLISDENCEYNEKTGEFIFPDVLNLTIKSLMNNNICLIDNGFILYYLYK